MFWRKKKVLKSPFIRVLEYGESVGHKGISRLDFLDWAAGEGLGRSGVSFHFDECFYGVPSNKVLKMEYYSRLIEWRELQEARLASKQANRNSWIAIVLSLFAIGITSYFAWTQINSPIKLHDDTIQQLARELKSE